MFVVFYHHAIVAVGGRTLEEELARALDLREEEVVLFQLVREFDES